MEVSRAHRIVHRSNEATGAFDSESCPVIGSLPSAMLKNPWTALISYTDQVLECMENRSSRDGTDTLACYSSVLSHLYKK